MWYVGVDQHKRFSQVAVMDDRGKVVDERKLYHDDPGKLRSYFRRWGNGIAILEATRNWDWLYDLLEEIFTTVKMSNPGRTRIIAEARVKTDKVDARVLAHLARTGFLPEAYTPSSDIRDAREMHRYRIWLLRIQTQVKNRIHTILDRLGIRHPWTDLFGKRGRQFLESLRLRPPYSLEMKGLLRVLDRTAAEIGSAMRAIRKTLREIPECGLLMTVPGIGEVLAYLVLYEVGEISRFPSEKKFAAYCCLVPSTRQSADHTYHGRTGRNGNLYLKWAFVEAAHKAIKGDPYLGAWYERLCRKRGKGKAIVAVARKLAVAVYHMLRNGVEYRLHHKSDFGSGKPAETTGCRQR